jgi:hypothetical protein
MVRNRRSVRPSHGTPHPMPQVAKRAEHTARGPCRHHPGPDSWWILLEFYGLIGSLPRKIAPLVLLENCGTHTDLVHSARCDKELEASGG